MGADAIKLSDGKATVTGDTSKANNEFGDKVRCGEQVGFTGPQLYYKVDLEADKAYEVKVTSTDLALVGVFTGSHFGK